MQSDLKSHNQNRSNVYLLSQKYPHRRLLFIFSSNRFLLRDAMRIRAVSLLSPGVRPSVCPSVSHVGVAYCIQTAKDIVKVLPTR